MTCSTLLKGGGGEMLARETVSLVLLLVLLFVSVTPMGELSLFVIMVQHHDMQHIAENVTFRE